MSAPEGIPVAPAPWQLKGEAYWFIFNLSALPEGAYAPLEASSSANYGAFKGGLATVQIVRYKESPVGPYDELIFLPGAFTAPNGSDLLRITRIYVSSEASTYNGRKNWNIPKHVARFSFTTSGNETRIQVFPPTPDSPPFFSAVVKPVRFAPYIPFNTKYSPMNFLLAQPPLPADPSNPVLVGTNDWCTVLPVMKGWIHLINVSPAPAEGIPAGEFADGVGFPKFKPWSVGVQWSDGMDLEFPEAGTLDDKKTK